MTTPSVTTIRRVWPIVALIVIQSVCTVVFVTDVSTDLRLLGKAALTNLGSWAEIAATVGLILGIAFEAAVLTRLMRQQASMQQSLNVAAGALSDLMNGYFTQWALTPTEQDVAQFTIKGFSIAEIAVMRGSAEGTIKTHLNAIYRKAGVAGRAQLVSVLVEDLFQAPLLSQSPSSTARTAWAS